MEIEGYGDEAPQTAAPEQTAVVVRVTGFSADRVERMVAEQLVEQMREAVREHAQRAVEEALAEQLGTLAKERLAAEIDRVFAEGWTKTGQYGEKVGTATLKDRISDLLNHHDRYNSNRRWLDELVAESVKAHLGGDFKNEIERAQASFRKQVDELLAGKIAEGLRNAFGLRG